MPIVPNFIERTMFLSLNQGPGPVLDIWTAVAFRSVLAAVRLDVFDTLAAGPLTSDELAEHINASEEGVLRLLTVLTPLGCVKRHGERYANTAMTMKWLLRSSPTSFAPYFRYWGAIIPKLMDDLEDSIRRRRSPRNLYEWIEHEPEVSRDFQEALIALANFALGEVIGKLRLPDSARRLLAVGGGHAMYSVALCRKYPQLSAVVFDSPQALATGRANIDRAGIADRVSVQTGNFFRTINGLLGLSYFHLLQGQLYSFDEVARWFREAGFNTVRWINLLKAAGSSLVIGTR